MAVSVGKIAASGGGVSVSVDYYVNQVATDSHDYYAGHGEAAGVWHGRFAAALGLEGEVAAEQFRAILDGAHPTTGERLKAQRNRAVAGWDVTFSPPKSISALWALADSDTQREVRQAQAAAVDAAVGYLTRTACVARLGRNGVDRQDGSELGFLRCDFIHRCSREGDPQLHTHSILANILQAPDGRCAALDGGLTYQHAKAADGIYQAALRAELTRRLDVAWARRDDVWEVDGIPLGLCRQWSKRRSQIEEALEVRGIDTTKPCGRAAQTAALDTRNAKVAVEEGGSLHDRFHREATDAGHDPEQVLTAALARNRTLDLGEGHDRDNALLGEVVGPEGITERASSFSRREAITDLAGRHAIHANCATAATAQVERLADRLVDDDRVVPVLAPAARTTGELLRVRDDSGRIVRTVDQAERRYTTASLLAAEHELLTRAQNRAQNRQADGVAVIPEHLVEQVLAEHPMLDDDQQAMIRALASSGAGVDVVVGKAGTGKSTALGGYRAACDAADIPVIGVAPSASAAHQLGRSAGIDDTATVDRLLTEIDHGHRRLPHGVVVVLDEAGMCPTRNRLRLQQAVDAVGGKVVDVGDHRQIPSVDVGGGHYALTQRLGTSTLGVNHRFKDPVYRDAAELVRDRQPTAALELLRAQGAVSDHHDQPVDAWMQMVDDWLACRDQGEDALMLATERATVDQLNQLARAHLVHGGQVARKVRTYRTADDSRTIDLAAGDRVILRRNDARLPQPDGGSVAVRNGMTGHITRTGRNSVVVQLDPGHTTTDGPVEVVLPDSYVGAHVDYSYARTVDTAQGATTDHSLFAASEATSAERAYVALSRGRLSNRVYATADQGWVDAIGQTRSHTLAVDQHPDLTRTDDALGIDAQQLPEGLAARRAALHAALRRRRRARGRSQPAPERTQPHRPAHGSNRDRDDTGEPRRERTAGLGM